MDSIETYYNALAPAYDHARFGNSYGQFIHAQECRALAGMLGQTRPEFVLDLACGTGRLLDFAQTGCDLSPQMLAQAQQKFPGKTLVSADATRLPFADAAFKSVFSMHFFMHIDRETTAGVFTEVHRILNTGGCFIFDFPSEKRRRFTGGHHDKNWHGSNAISMDWLLELAKSNGWKINDYQGIMFFPIHRAPVFIRPQLHPLDSFFCRSFLKEYASYLMVCLQKI